MKHIGNEHEKIPQLDGLSGEEPIEKPVKDKSSQLQTIKSMEAEVQTEKKTCSFCNKLEKTSTLKEHFLEHWKEASHSRWIQHLVIVA